MEDLDLPPRLPACLEEKPTSPLLKRSCGRKAFLLRDAWNGPELVPVTQCSLSRFDADQMCWRGTGPGRMLVDVGTQVCPRDPRHVLAAESKTAQVPCAKRAGSPGPRVSLLNHKERASRPLRVLCLWPMWSCLCSSSSCGPGALSWITGKTRTQTCENCPHSYLIPEAGYL